MTLINIRLDIQYDGSDFSGWQVQNNAPTIQGEIESAIEKITGQTIRLKAAGRTDAGVHALGQVANFEIDHNISPDKYKDAINHFLPDSILITSAREVPSEFHARKSAGWRQYKYIIGLKRSALYYKYRWEYDYPLDLERMNKIAEFVIGKHDFSSFCVISSLKENNECIIDKSSWRRGNDSLIYEVRANRFLHSMVRSLVGAMVEAGRENDYLTLNDFEDILNSRDHTRLKTVAPARGLYLVAVGY